MNSHWSSRICCSILLFFGFSQPLFIEVPQSSLNGTVGQSVLLSVSFKFNCSVHLSLPIRWNFNNTPDTLISYTVTNCSACAAGIPARCAEYYTHQAYRSRTVFFPENASLLLQNLQLNDSGVYSISFGTVQQTRDITLTVSRGNPEKNPYLLPGLLVTAGFSLLLVLLLLVFCFRWHMAGEVQQRKRRIMKQQEVSNQEESPMESSMPKTVSTIYARIGEDVGNSQPTLGSQPEYASICFS
ncbi:uncharacterized protein LOC142818253 [Pelodiscus sinensis]|uniref:uncharacterized protein LOC142818253 n=1 Tax=Pelodiscus sinensis TaxID=13735 RepID=UPI003F6BEE16